MQISKEQMDTLSKEELAKFEQRIADFLQDEFSDAKEIPQKELMPVIQEQVCNARRYDLETERQIANYVTTAWLLGQQFDTKFPAAYDRLSSSDHSAENKSEWLVQWTEEMFEALEGDH